MSIVKQCRVAGRFSRAYCDGGTHVGYILDLIPRQAFETMIENNCKMFNNVVDFDIELFDTVNGSDV